MEDDMEDLYGDTVSEGVANGTDIKTSPRPQSNIRHEAVGCSETLPITQDMVAEGEEPACAVVMAQDNDSNHQDPPSVSDMKENTKGTILPTTQGHENLDVEKPRSYTGNSQPEKNTVADEQMNAILSIEPDNFPSHRLAGEITTNTSQSDAKAITAVVTEDQSTVLQSRSDEINVSCVSGFENEALDQQAEWEPDSSTYESTSDETSDSSSCASDEDYEMLDPAEQARRLMEDEGNSDEDGGPKGSKGAQIKSHNERAEEPVEKPDITVTPSMKIEELGVVETIVDKTVLIKARISGEYQVLETRSLLCLGDRTVLGVVSETLGRVHQPLYCLRFTDELDIKAAGVTQGTLIYYVPQHSTFVFTKALQAVKGSDASNIHDEEICEDEIEFSDDEAEAEYKRNLKALRQAKRTGKNGLPQQRSNMPSNRLDPNSSDNTSYNIESHADLYTPLVRPSNLHEMMDSRVNQHLLPNQFRGRSRGPRASHRARGDRKSHGATQNSHFAQQNRYHHQVGESIAPLALTGMATPTTQFTQNNAHIYGTGSGIVAPPFPLQQTAPYPPQPNQGVQGFHQIQPLLSNTQAPNQPMWALQYAVQGHTNHQPYNAEGVSSPGAGGVAINPRFFHQQQDHFAGSP